ncbi:MAG TPA: helix-turn-helix transcriptional regulator [Flavobacteriaceae bacterium]|nr:helix-turn-helix transcriptional regulator [Flavobacteriaceae bacterium]
MLNNEKFVKRLQEILDYYDLSATSFADKINVGRSSISHIVSGRNKPSLDFVIKVNAAFPEIELNWLLNGKGDFPSSPNEKNLPSSPSDSLEKKSVNFLKNFPTKNSKIDKIVFFYDDGSFEVFEN